MLQFESLFFSPLPPNGQADSGKEEILLPFGNTPDGCPHIRGLLQPKAAHATQEKNTCPGVQAYFLGILVKNLLLLDVPGAMMR